MELAWADSTDDLVLALNEAAANVVDHAYLAAAVAHYQQSEVQAEQQRTADGDQRVLIEVRDRGRWRSIPANPGHRGRGLLMMRACTDELDIAPTPTGTCVTIISRPVRQTCSPAPSNEAAVTTATGPAA